MPIKNYTTKVPANRSINEIQDSIVKNGATGFLLEYEEGTGRIEALKFILPFGENKIPFALPVNWRKFQQLLLDQNVNRAHDDDYCYRVAWRCIRDWVLAQMALYETEMVTLPQIFLPYAMNQQGKTMYQIVLDNKLLLGKPE